MKRLLVLLAMTLAFGLTSPSAGAATLEQWRQGLDGIVADLRAAHPEPFGKIGEARFMREAEAIRRDLPSLTDEQRSVRLMQLVALIEDGHTQLQPQGPAMASWYPFRIYDFEDGYFITGAHRSVADLAGAQILTVNGRPAAEAIDAARTLMGGDNRWDRRERLYALLNSRLMIGLGLAQQDGGLRLRLRLRSGRTLDRVVMPVAGQSSDFSWIVRPEYWGAVGAPEEWISAYRGLTVAQLRTLDESRPLHLRYRRAFYGAHVSANNVYYIQANLVGGTAEESLPAFFRRHLAEIDRIRPRHLIIDLRYNFGGDGSNVPPITRMFLARGDNPPWGNLYVLTGRRTFSAGVLWTADFLSQLNPTLVGEPAGAPLNFHGDANSFTYPDIGLRMSVSYERHQRGNSRDLSPIIPVDIPARFTFADYAEGGDPAIEAILNSDARGIGSIAVAEGASAAFAVYDQRRLRFAADDSWRPATEIQLRMIARSLADQQRRDEAIQVATLNTRINPQEWRTWMNLGDLQIAAGQADAGIESFRRSLALNDPTNFNTERLQRAVTEADARRQSQPQPARP